MKGEGLTVKKWQQLYWEEGQELNSFLSPAEQQHLL